MWNMNPSRSIPRFDIFSPSSIIIICVFFISSTVHHSTNADQVLNNEINTGRDNSAVESYRTNLINRRNTIFKREVTIEREPDVDNEKMPRVESKLDALHRDIDRTMDTYRLMRDTAEYQKLNSESYAEAEQLSRNDSRRNVSVVDTTKQSDSNITTVVPILSEFEEQNKTDALNTTKIGELEKRQITDERATVDYRIETVTDRDILNGKNSTTDKMLEERDFRPPVESSKSETIVNNPTFSPIDHTATSSQLHDTDKMSSTATPLPNFHDDTKSKNVTPETRTQSVRDESSSANTFETVNTPIPSSTARQTEEIVYRTSVAGEIDSTLRILNARRSPEDLLEPNFPYDGETATPTSQNKSTGNQLKSLSSTDGVTAGPTNQNNSTDGQLKLSSSTDGVTAGPTNQNISTSHQLERLSSTNDGATVRPTSFDNSTDRQLERSSSPNDSQTLRPTNQDNSTSNLLEPSSSTNNSETVKPTSRNNSTDGQLERSSSPNDSQTVRPTNQNNSTDGQLEPSSSANDGATVKSSSLNNSTDNQLEASSSTDGQTASPTNQTTSTNYPLESSSSPNDSETARPTSLDNLTNNQSEPSPSTNNSETARPTNQNNSTDDKLEPSTSTIIPTAAQISNDNTEEFFKHEYNAALENRENETDSKSSYWKRVCFQNVEQIRHSLENDVINLPDNKADLYIFYYVPKSSAASDHQLLLAAKNPDAKRYNGGYLKHKYTKDNASDPDKYNGLSLQQHKLLQSYDTAQSSEPIRARRLADCPPCSSSISETVGRSSTCPPCPGVPAAKSEFYPPPHCTYIPFLSNFTYDSLRARAAVIAKSTTARAETAESKQRSRRSISASKIQSLLPNAAFKLGLNCTGNIRWCDDRSNCIEATSWCDAIIDCSDGSDEMRCSCKERMDADKLCDGYYDCPGGEDERGCFGCPKEYFSCEDWSRWKQRATCISVSQRCNRHIDCANKKDEKDCALLTDSINSHETFSTSYVTGYLHRNWKGKWYPVCLGINDDNYWGRQACESELGTRVRHVETELLPYYNKYNGSFIVDDGDRIRFVPYCVQPGYAVHVNCPSITCGSRVTRDDFQSNYRSKRETLLGNAAAEVQQQTANSSIGSTNRTRRNPTEKIVGGDFSHPGRWPWLVAVYKDGNFHCGGAILDEMWIVSAAHCVKGYEQHYFEIQAGILRRLSFSPSEQIRAVTHVIMHPEYTHVDMKNDIALLHVDKPLKFNRWVRPTCLPEARPPWGPVPGTFCTAVGWGSTHEKGSDPDSLKEVEMPILPTCKRPADREGDEICAGFLNGGHDTCQGDSGGPLMCRIPFGHDRWYVGGVVSHGEGCGRAFEPGAYTRIALFLPWLVENTDRKYLTPVRKSKQQCPGLKCAQDGRCIARSRVCDNVIDCLDADDEMNCGDTYSTAFVDDSNVRHARKRVDSKRVDATKNAQKFESFSTWRNERVSTARDANGDKTADAENELEVIDHFECTLLHQEIPKIFYCDGDVDCEDGTDEMNCTCADLLKTLNKSRICDGIVDCHDLTDEKMCPDRNCTNDQFFCYKSRVCVSSRAVCDNKQDCPQGEDEQSCYALFPLGKNRIKIDVDIFGKPSFAERGLVAQNKENTWRLLCDYRENDANESTSVQKLATRLGFKGCKDFKGVLVLPDDDLRSDTDVSYCRGVEVDFGLAYIDDESVIPWRATIYVNGMPKYFAFVIETRWILTDRAFCKNFDNETDYAVAVLGGNEEHSRTIRSYREQIIKIDGTICSAESETSLLHLNEPVNITEQTRILHLSETGERQSPNKRCLLTTRNFTGLSIHELNVETNCSSNHHCYGLSQKSEFCSNWNTSAYKNAAIICLSNNFWFLSSLIDRNLTYCDTDSTVLEVNRFHLESNSIHFDNIEPLAMPKCDGFRCNLGACIPWNKVCDGKPECREREDESATSCEMKTNLCRRDSKYCVCKVHEFKCKNERCVPKSAVCDGNNDCGDESDEPESCANFTCANYLNVTDPSKICDSFKDCLDKSDEDINYCPSLCNFNSTFRCASGNICIPMDFVCDGERDCDSGEDEKDCRTLSPLQIPDHNNHTNEGVLWIRSNGKWERECVTADFTSLNVEQLCADFGFTRVVDVKSLQTSHGLLSAPFVHLKLNGNVKDIAIKRNVLGKSALTESCDFIHLTCK